MSTICSGINGAAKGTDILSKIFAGVVAYMGNRSCYDMGEYNYPTETNVGWRWQVTLLYNNKKFRNGITFKHNILINKSSSGFLIISDGNSTRH